MLIVYALKENSFSFAHQSLFTDPKTVVEILLGLQRELREICLKLPQVMSQSQCWKLHLSLNFKKNICRCSNGTQKSQFSMIFWYDG